MGRTKVRGEKFDLPSGKDENTGFEVRFTKWEGQSARLEVGRTKVYIKKAHNQKGNYEKHTNKSY